MEKEKSLLGEQAKQSIFNFIVLWDSMPKFELNDLKHVSEEVNSGIVTGYGIGAVKLTYGDYNLQGSDDVSW